MEGDKILSVKSGDGVLDVFVGDDFVFSLSEQFPHEYINEVFVLADKMFAQGMQFGVKRSQDAVLQALGIAQGTQES